MAIRTNDKLWYRHVYEFINLVQWFYYYYDVITSRNHIPRKRSSLPFSSEKSRIICKTVTRLRPERFYVINEIRRKQSAVPKEWMYLNLDFADNVQHSTIVWSSNINAPRNMIHICMLNEIEKHTIFQREDNKDFD